MNSSQISLSRKPEAQTWSVEDLLEMVKRGEVRLPEFQRLFKWGQTDVVNLFDSLARGFPLGTLLFWQRLPGAGAAGRPLEADAARDAQAEGNALYWVIDGQQRLTSLRSVLLATELPVDPRFRVVFDLDKDEFVHLRNNESPSSRRLALHQAFDTVRLLAWMDAHRQELSDKDRESAMGLNKALREYRLPGYVVHADDENTAALIFDRTNASGKKLKKPEVFKALQSSRAAQEPSSIEAVAKSVELLGFGPLHDDVFLQAAVAVAGLDVTKINRKVLGRKELKEALEPTATALRHVLRFLREDARIPNSALLPYRFPIVGLARLFTFFPNPKPRSRELLSRWVWRGALTGKHRARDNEYVRATMASIRGVDEEAEMQELLVPLHRTDAHFHFSRFSLHAADTRMFVLALLALQPRDLRTGELLDGAGLVATHGARAVIPIVPNTVKTTTEKDAPESLFSRVIQPPLGHASLLKLLRAAQTEVTTSLGLTPHLVDLLRQHAFSDFASEHMTWLRYHVESFLNSRAHWGESDRPSLEAFVVGDE